MGFPSDCLHLLTLARPASDTAALCHYMHARCQQCCAHEWLHSVLCAGTAAGISNSSVPVATGGSTNVSSFISGPTASAVLGQFSQVCPIKLLLAKLVKFHWHACYAKSHTLCTSHIIAIHVYIILLQSPLRAHLRLCHQCLCAYTATLLLVSCM